MGRAPQETHPGGFTGNVLPDRTGSSWQRLTWWSYCPLPLWGVAVGRTEIRAHLLGLKTNEECIRSLILHSPSLGESHNTWLISSTTSYFPPGWSYIVLGRICLCHCISRVHPVPHRMWAPLSQSSLNQIFPSSSFKLWPLMAEFQLASNEQKALLLPIILGASKLILK